MGVQGRRIGRGIGGGNVGGGMPLTRLGLGLGTRNLARGISSVDYASFMAFDPRDVAGLVAWYDPTDASSITQAGGFVSQISDKSGAGLHLTQGTGANQPPYLTAGLNGKNAISFTGNPVSLSRTGMSLTATAYTVISVATLISSADANARLFAFAPAALNDNDNSSFIPDRRNASAAQVCASANSPTPVHAITYGTSFLHSSSRTATLVSSYLNGADLQTIAASTALGTIARFFAGNGTGTAYWVGLWGGTLIYSGILSDFDRQRVEGWLMWKLGLQGSLDGAHPYRYAAPFSPRDVPGMLAWLDPTDSAKVTIATGVSQLTDKSGNAKNLTQATGANQPTYGADAAIGNLNAITFNGTSHNLLNTALGWLLPGITTLTAGTIGAASVSNARMVAMAVTGVADTGLSATVGPRRPTTLQQTSAVAGAAVVTHSLPAYDTYFIQSIRRGDTVASGLKSRLNGADLKVVTPDTTLASLDRMAVGTGLATGAAGTQFIAGKWAGTIVYNSIISDDNLVRAEGFLAWKLGLQSALDAAHPWKSSPPTLAGVTPKLPLGTPVTPIPRVAASTTTLTNTGFTPPTNGLLLVIHDGRANATIAAFTVTNNASLVQFLLSDLSYDVASGIRARQRVYGIPIGSTAPTNLIFSSTNGASARQTLQFLFVPIGMIPSLSEVGSNTSGSGNVTVNMSHAPAAASVMIGIFGGPIGTDTPITPVTGYTELEDLYDAAGQIQVQTSYKAGSGAQANAWTTGASIALATVIEMVQP